MAMGVAQVTSLSSPGDTALPEGVLAGGGALAGGGLLLQQRDVGVDPRHWVMSIYAVVKDPRRRKRQARDVKRESLNPSYRTKKRAFGVL